MRGRETTPFLRLAPFVTLILVGMVALLGVGIVILAVPLPAAVIAALIAGAAALLLLVGALVFRGYTATLQAMYAVGTMPRPGTADPPTYAAWYNAQPWWVQVPAVEP
jgi:hypothetical protein